MRTPLNTEYKILTIYFIIHTSISLQFKVYSPKFVIKFLAPTTLPFLKICRRETHGAVTIQHPKRR